MSVSIGPPASLFGTHVTHSAGAGVTYQGDETGARLSSAAQEFLNSAHGKEMLSKHAKDISARIAPVHKGWALDYKKANGEASKRWKVAKKEDGSTFATFEEVKAYLNKTGLSQEAKGRLDQSQASFEHNTNKKLDKNAHEGVLMQDIANLPFDLLTINNKRLNSSMAEFVIALKCTAPHGTSPEELASAVHEYWMDSNKWQFEGKSAHDVEKLTSTLFMPFSKLSKAEKDKDRIFATMFDGVSFK